jgi:C-terminal processing protease CtpA/Prc
LAEGDYADAEEGELFALALTLHLQEVSHDEHLWVRWHPEPLPEQEGQLRQNQAWQEAQRLQASLDNYGLYRVERLPGNIGYLGIHYLQRPNWGGDTAAAAMNFLSNTQALIIDLRQCTGGYPGMIALMCSYLFGEEPVHLDSIYWRDDDKTQQYWTLPFVPGKRYVEKPVYVLVSKVTFSAGEGFAYILQSRQRATLLGEKTDGGAHPGASYRLHPHFEAFIPIGRGTNPVTGTDWEGTGVLPDIVLPQAQAFTAAYRMALKAALAGLGDSPTGARLTLKEEVQKALQELAPG